MDRMSLREGIFVDKEATFGKLMFSACRREEFELDEEGKVTNKVLSRTYDLKSRAQGKMIQIKIPAQAGEKDFEYNAEVDIINPVIDTVATARFYAADVDWYIKADDIVLKGKSSGVDFKKTEEKANSGGK